MEKILTEQNDTLRDIIYQCVDVIPDPKVKNDLILVNITSQKFPTNEQNVLLKSTLRKCVPQITDAIFCDGVLGVLDSMELASTMENENENQL